MVVSVEQVTFVKQGIGVVCQVFGILCVCVCVCGCACALWHVCVHVHAAICYHLPHTFRSVVCYLLLWPFISQNFFLNPYRNSQSETNF